MNGSMHLYKEVMIKGGSHTENILACETQNHIGNLTRPFFRVWRARLEVANPAKLSVTENPYTKLTPAIVGSHTSL